MKKVFSGVAFRSRSALRMSPGRGLAAIAGLAQRVRAKINFADRNSFFAKQPKQFAIAFNEIAVAKIAKADALLVAHDAHRIARFLQMLQRLGNAGQQFHLPPDRRWRPSPKFHRGPTSTNLSRCWEWAGSGVSCKASA